MCVWSRRGKKARVEGGREEEAMFFSKISLCAIFFFFAALQQKNNSIPFVNFLPANKKKTLKVVATPRSRAHEFKLLFFRPSL